MAETRVTNPTTPSTTTAEPAKKSPVRTLILFCILLLVIAAYAHDYFVAGFTSTVTWLKAGSLASSRL